MKFKLANHAPETMERRGIPREMLELVLGSPQQVVVEREEKEAYISPAFAKRTGFTQADLNVLFEALALMFRNDSSAARAEIVLRGLYDFKHVGTDSNAAQRVRQAMLGCAPAQQLLDFSTPDCKIENTIIEIKHRKGLAGSPRTFAGYVVETHRDRLPAGVELLP